jgi:hypothetical protein
MNDIGAYTMIGLGAFAVIWLVVGLFFGGKYYGSMVGPVGKRTPIPKWLGHLWFLAFALVMFYFGFSHFLKKR